MKTTYKILAGALFLSLTACQQDFSANSAALRATEKYVATVSKSFPTLSKRGVTASRGLSSFDQGYSNYVYPQTWQNWSNQWNQASQTGVYGGTNLMYPSMTDETVRCQQMVNAIPEKLENLEFMIGTLERCLFRLAINKSAPMNYMWRNEDPSIISYGGYLNDYARPGQYGTYNYDGYSQFLMNGQNSQLNYNPYSQYGY